jgi:plastocyanin
MSQDLRSPPRTHPREPEAAPDRRRPRLPPIAYPVLGLAFGTALVWAFSRILLAVGETELFGDEDGGKSVASAIALLMALNVLIGAALVAYGRRVRRRPVSMPFLLMAGLVLIGVGAVANTVIGGEEEVAGGEAPAAPAVPLVAEGLQFDTGRITVHPGETVEVRFRNEDAGVQHNFSLYASEDATESLFEGEIFAGVATMTYTFQAPPPGEYFFRCDVHPTTMTGTFQVAAGPEGGEGGEGGAGPGQPGAVELAAQNTAFTPTELAVSPAAGKVTIRFENKDADVPHNVAIFEGSDATGEVVFQGEIFNGPGSMDYVFDAPPPGTYFFHCDVHPQQMQGTITVGE